MTFKLNFITLIAIITLWAACASPKSNSTLDQKASWLLGTWEQQNIEGTAIEYWRKMDDSTYHSFSFFVEQGDTVSSEHIQLISRSGTLYFIPTVKRQNNNQPVEFKESMVKDDELIFENPSHDFPQRVRYSLPKKDSMYAEISGKVQGVDKAIGFPYHKKP